jgi:hypothetical protein
LSRQEKNAKEGDRGAADFPSVVKAKAGINKTRFAQTVFDSDPLLPPRHRQRRKRSESITNI